MKLSRGADDHYTNWLLSAISTLGNLAEPVVQLFVQSVSEEKKNTLKKKQDGKQTN